MNRFPRSILKYLAALAFTFLEADDQCFICHQMIDDEVAAQFVTDIHYAKGISCADCHGGDRNAEDMDESMNPAIGYRGIPHGDDVSKTCSNCHSNREIMKKLGSSLPAGQWESILESVHGKASIKGKENILQCTTCHGIHNIVHVKDAASPVSPVSVTKTCTKCHANASYMRLYNPALPIDQLEKYKTSIHGMLNLKGDKKVAQCSSCHGSHNIFTANDPRSTVYPLNVPSTCARCHADKEYMKGFNISTDQFEKFSTSVHGVALLEKKDVSAPSCNDCHGNHGAIPPGLSSVSQVCGSCHALNASLFASSPHKKAFVSMQLPECETCHGYHNIVHATNDLLGADVKAVCSKCHSSEKNAKGFQVASTMRGLIDSLDYKTALAKELIHEAEQRGMEISDAKFKLRDVHQARIQSRTAVHSFDEPQFREVVEKGLALVGSITDEAKLAVDEYYFRRWGLGGATLIITFLCVVLYLTIRKIEERQKTGEKF